MILLLASVAFGQQTKLFETDEAAAEWIRQTRSGMRVTLPVVGPQTVKRLAPLLERVDYQAVVVPDNEDPDAVALGARLRAGSPCALALAPVEEGWAGWSNGRCGLLFIGSWRIVGDRVVDDRGIPITTSQFAADSGDRDVLRTTRRLDRRRGNSLWTMGLGVGLLYAGSVGRAGAKASDEDTTGWTVAIASGAALTATGVGLFAWVQSDKRSHPRRLESFYTPEEIQERVTAHNARLRVVLTVSPGGAGLSGSF